MHSTQTKSSTTPTGETDSSSLRAGPARPAVAAARRIVIKLGSQVLTTDEGELDRHLVRSIVATAAALRNSGRQVLLVSSGAVSLGRNELGLERLHPHRGLRQACAAVGQARLMTFYERISSSLGLSCGQVLVSHHDLQDRRRALNLRRTLDALLTRGVLPVINENDALCDDGEPDLTPAFTDNDRLAALIASEVSAQLLLLLTDVDGLFDRDPKRDAGARLLSHIEDLGALPEVDPQPGSAISRGGMYSKVEAARIACLGGCHTLIANGRQAGTLSHAVAGEEIGTWLAAGDSLGARKRWIALTAPSHGALYLDAGAVTALRLHHSSLLAAGVERVCGRFPSGAVVELRSRDGSPVARALVRMSSNAIRKRCKSLDSSNPNLISRSDIVLTKS